MFLKWVSFRQNCLVLIIWSIKVSFTHFSNMSWRTFQCETGNLRLVSGCGYRRIPWSPVPVHTGAYWIHKCRISTFTSFGVSFIFKRKRAKTKECFPSRGIWNFFKFMNVTWAAYRTLQYSVFRTSVQSTRSSENWRGLWKLRATRQEQRATTST